VNSDGFAGIDYSNCTIVHKKIIPTFSYSPSNPDYSGLIEGYVVAKTNEYSIGKLSLLIFSFSLI